LEWKYKVLRQSHRCRLFNIFVLIAVALVAHLWRTFHCFPLVPLLFLSFLPCIVSRCISIECKYRVLRQFNCCIIFCTTVLPFIALFLLFLTFFLLFSCFSLVIWVCWIEYICYLHCSFVWRCFNSTRDLCRWLFWIYIHFSNVKDIEIDFPLQNLCFKRFRYARNAIENYNQRFKDRETCLDYSKAYALKIAILFIFTYLNVLWLFIWLK
jgi:hypothetical protein